MQQLAYRRGRENEVFTWSSTILVGFVGAALLLWQLKQRYFLAETQRVIVDIERALGLFTSGTVTLPKHWETWGAKNAAFGERVRKPSKITATILLGVLATCSALLSAYLKPL